MSSPLFGGIEAGGTKFVCAAGSGPDDLRALTRFATTTPGETLDRVVRFFREQMENLPLAAVGIASFGPVDINPASPSFGCITGTPKEGWLNTNFAGIVRDALGVPVVLDTDVNAAALGESKWGAAQGLETFLYLTVGTGIGGGGLVNGKLMHGLLHPEMGHIRIPHDLSLDPFTGSCPYHGDCLEGLASGKAVEMRWGCKPEDLPSGHPGWDLESDYIAAGLANFIVVLSPQKIIVGGGISKKPGLLTAVRRKVVELLNGYVDSPEITGAIENYIVSPGLGDLSGVLGAIALAKQR